MHDAAAKEQARHQRLTSEALVGCRMAKPLPESEYGPPIRFRESSFMANPQLPAATNASKLLVTVCEPGVRSLASPVLCSVSAMNSRSNTENPQLPAASSACKLPVTVCESGVCTLTHALAAARAATG